MFLVAATLKCEPFHAEEVISCENRADLLRLRQKMKRKKPQNRISRTTPQTMPPTIVVMGVVEELDDEPDYDEVLGTEPLVKWSFANKSQCPIDHNNQVSAYRQKYQKQHWH
jgi:hypothetical protein